MSTTSTRVPGHRTRRRRSSVSTSTPTTASSRSPSNAKLSFVAALHDGRVVGAAGPEAGPASHRIRAPRLDTVVVYTLDPTSLRVCVDFVEDPTGAPSDDWHGVRPIVTGLTLPFRELMPTLHSRRDELAEARSRLLPGEDIGARRVRPPRRRGATDADGGRTAAAVRARAARPRRPDRRRRRGTRARPAPADARPPDVAACARLRSLRRRPCARAGRDLRVPGERHLPGSRRSRREPRLRHGPVRHAAAGRVRARRAAGPCAAVRSRSASHPAPRTAGSCASRGRGIQLDPTRESFWTGPGLDDWSLVVDFATPVSAVVLELAPGHDLVYGAGAAIGAFLDIDPVPSEPSRPDRLRRRGRAAPPAWQGFPARAAGAHRRRHRHDRSRGRDAAGDPRRHAAAGRTPRRVGGEPAAGHRGTDEPRPCAGGGTPRRARVHGHLAPRAGVRL